MKLFSFTTAISSALLFSSALARYGLSPDTIPLLTKTIDYTFHTICDEFHNPVPTPMFDEAKLASIIVALSSDIYTFLMGYSIDDQDDTRDMTKYAKRGPDLLETLIDEIIDSNSRSDLLESQMPLVKGPLGSKLQKQERPTTHRYASDEFDCSQFQRDVVKFAETFKNMTYAVSEKCYRQCEPNSYYGSASYALNRLQTAYERHVSGSFYAQIRAIEAETGCYFNDTFMIDTERAVDYAKVWVDTFQRRERPCEGVGK